MDSQQRRLNAHSRPVMLISMFMENIILILSMLGRNFLSEPYGNLASSLSDRNFSIAIQRRIKLAVIAISRNVVAVIRFEGESWYGAELTLTLSICTKKCQPGKKNLRLVVYKLMWLLVCCTTSPTFSYQF